MSYDDTEPRKQPRKQPPDDLEAERVQREATAEEPTANEVPGTTDLKAERVQRQSPGGEP